jgi:hypothetical protein
MARSGRKSGATSHPFVQRMIEDPELRSTLSDAVGKAKAVFTQLNAHKSPGKKLADDRKLQGEVRDALETLHQATAALAAEQVATEHRRRRTGRRFLALLSLGTLISFVTCPGLRNKALDKLFGAEEEFQYSPAPVAPTPPAEESAAAANESQVGAL